jgi:hypothetical protein
MTKATEIANNFLEHTKDLNSNSEFTPQLKSSLDALLDMLKKKHVEMQELWEEMCDMTGCCLGNISIDEEFEDLHSLMTAVEGLEPTGIVVADPLRFALYFETTVPVDYYTDDRRNPVPGECPLLHVVANCFDVSGANEDSVRLEESNLKDKEGFKALEGDYSHYLSVFLSALLTKENIESGKIKVEHERACEENSLTITTEYGSSLWISLGYDDDFGGGGETHFTHQPTLLDLIEFQEIVEEWKETHPEQAKSYPTADLIWLIFSTWTCRYRRIHMRYSSKGVPFRIAFSSTKTEPWLLEENLFSATPDFDYSDMGVEE